MSLTDILYELILVLCSSCTKTKRKKYHRILNLNRFEKKLHFKFNGKVDPFQEIKEFYGFIWSLGNFLFVLNSDPNWNSFRIFGYHSNRNARVHFNYHLQLLLNIHFNARVPSKCSALVCFHCFFFICWVFFLCSISAFLCV